MKRVRRWSHTIVCGAMLLPFPAHADATKEACVSSATNGQLRRDEGKLLAAHESFLACAQEACPALVREDCAKWAEQTRTQLPSIVLGARDEAGRDRTDVVVTVDGAPFATSLDGLPKALDPGPHRLHLASDDLSADVDVALRAYEPPRVIVVTLHPSDVATVTKEVTATDQVSGRRPLWPIFALGGASLGAAITAASLVVVAHGQSSALDDRCAPRCTPSDTAGLDRSILFANVAAGVSVLALAGALVVALVRPGAATTKATPAVSLGPLTLDRGGGASAVIRY